MKYWILTFKGIKKSLYYRKATILTIIFAFLQMYLLNLFWKAIYWENIDSYHYMLKYSIIAQTLSTIYFFDLGVTADIRNGNIAYRLLKPWSYPILLFFENLGNMLGNFFCIGLPMLIGGTLIWKLDWLSIEKIFLGLISILLSYLILFLIKLISEFLCFWFIEAWTFNFLIEVIIRLFSGKFLPSFIMPKLLEIVVQKLPFIWIYQRPIELLLEEKRGFSEELMHSFDIWGKQIEWILGLTVVCAFFWIYGQKKVIVQGG